MFNQKVENQLMPLLQVLREGAWIKYNSKEVFTNEHGKVEVYSSYHAAEDTVRQAGITDESFLDLIKQTTAKSQVIVGDVGLMEGFVTYDKFKEEASISIVAWELHEHHPEVKDIDTRREEILESNPPITPLHSKCKVDSTATY